LKGDTLNKEEIEKRKKSIMVTVLNKEVNTYTGEEANLIRAAQGLTAKIYDVHELTGMPASKGVYVGPAKVCHGVVDAANKIEEGDVLITNMTLPDYLPYMKKAGAIVTNEGGVTCHAAVVSRELGKPCVIATMHATSVFKDGELLEVNANTGVVRKV
jgi:phosphoenolpyruvate synthase/pyruvate phosphate dikinase